MAAEKTLQCRACGQTFEPEPFPTQDENEAYDDPQLEQMLCNFLFSDEMSNVNSDVGEAKITQWIERTKDIWETHCATCRYDEI